MNRKTDVVAGVFSKNAKLYADRFMDVSGQAEVLDTFCLLLSGNTVLDLGCGPGNISLYLNNKLPNLNFTCTDVAKDMLVLAETYLGKGQFVQMNALKLHELPIKYDGIVANFLLPYIEPQELDLFVERIYHQLNPGGVVLIHTMEADMELSGIEAPSTGEEPFLFINYYRAHHLMALMEKHQFKSVLCVREKKEEAKYIGDVSIIAIK